MCPRVSSERSGTKPGRVRPEAITVMKVLGTDISGTVDEQLARIDSGSGGHYNHEMRDRLSSCFRRGGYCMTAPHRLQV